MSLPYQSKFIYRPRRNTPVPASPYGEYIRPTPGFDGFNGPDYTLGSLSNKPGTDWALPQYIRDAPLMYMAGFGQDDDDLNKYLDQLDEEGYAPEGTQAPWEEEQSLWDKGQEYLKTGGEYLQKGVQAYEDVKKVVDTLKQPTQPPVSIPPSYQYTPPPPQTAPIPPAQPTTPAQPTFGKMQLIQAKLHPAMLPAIRALAAKKAEEQKKKKSNTLLILGAVGVGAYLLLRKKK